MSLRKYDKEWLSELCKESFSYSEVLQKAGRKKAGGNVSHLKKKISEFGIDISHFTGQAWSKGLTKETDERLEKISKKNMKFSFEEIFVKNSLASWNTIKRYIHKYNLKEYKCEICGCDGNWQGGVISLELDHINGDHEDNRLENLRFLCPNCHALTPTYGAKNIKINNSYADMVESEDTLD